MCSTRGSNSRVGYCIVCVANTYRNLEAEDNHLCGMRRQITCVDVSEELTPIIGQMMGAADSCKKSR